MSEPQPQSGPRPPQPDPGENQGDERQNDEQRMAAFRRGSAEAFADLFLRYKQPLFGFFRRRVVDPGLAEELTQEAFLAIIRGADRYQPGAAFRTYLYAVGLNLLRAHRRKTAFRATFLLSREDYREPAASGNPDAELWLRQALKKLDSVDREIILLRESEQLSYAEIAELLKLPLNTVRSRLFRARAALRDLLNAPAPTPAGSPIPRLKEGL